MKFSNKKIAMIFKALCDENRIEILEILKQGEHCACELLDQLQIGQSTLSHHMKILTDSGIVSSKKDGKWIHYHIDPNGFDQAIMVLNYFKEVEQRIPYCSK